MANTENLAKIRDAIQNEGNYFKMDEWDEPSGMAEYNQHVCGTPSCIGGWAESIINIERGRSSEQRVYLSDNELTEWMGLTLQQFNALCFPNVDDNNGMSATREQAVDHLNHIIETGEVDWKKFS